MLSVFPDLLPFGLLATTVIRVVIGLVLVYFAILTLFIQKSLVTRKLEMHKYPKPDFIIWPIGIVGLITGGFLVVGFLTQVAAIVAAYLFLNLSILDTGGEMKVFHQTVLFYVVMIIFSLTLLFSGPGFWAIDLPL